MNQDSWPDGHDHTNSYVADVRASHGLTQKAGIHVPCGTVDLF